MAGEIKKETVHGATIVGGVVTSIPIANPTVATTSGAVAAPAATTSGATGPTATLSGATLSGATLSGATFNQAILTRTTVDVGETSILPTIVRGGVAITAPTLNPQKVTDLLGTLVPISRPALPRTITQSIPAGTRVPKGTPVDIVLLSVVDIPFAILDNVHANLVNRSIADVQPVLQDPQVASILNKYTSADQVSDADKSALSNLLTTGLSTSNNPFVIDDTNPSTSFATAFQSLKMAQAFQ